MHSLFRRVALCLRVYNVYLIRNLSIQFKQFINTFEIEPIAKMVASSALIWFSISLNPYPWLYRISPSPFIKDKPRPGILWKLINSSTKVLIWSCKSGGIWLCPNEIRTETKKIKEIEVVLRILNCYLNSWRNMSELIFAKFSIYIQSQLKIINRE